MKWEENAWMTSVWSRVVGLGIARETQPISTTAHIHSSKLGTSSMRTCI